MTASRLFDLTGKVALVSGAARGMGRAMALALAAHGADLMLVDLNAEGLADTSAKITALGRRACSSCRDISLPSEVEALFTEFDRQFDRLDFLANVAGGDVVLEAPEEASTANVERAWRGLVLGRFSMCQQAGRRMIAQKGGSIVNIGSLASITALGRGHISYSMAMGAVAQMTRELSTEWSAHGVRVNAILPAQVVNPSLETRMQADPTLRDRWLKGIPRGRLGQPEDVQGLAVLLASDASSWITGALIPMDGGNLAMNAGGTRRYTD
jgi:NAD(P)-dependent dehydrogenase (short-subunit alcohol dehydrogenase family)